MVSISISQSLAAQSTFLGMDRNDYPGDASMKALKKTFAFTGYWLNNPPGATSNTWTGKRADAAADGLWISAPVQRTRIQRA